MSKLTDRLREVIRPASDPRSGAADPRSGGPSGPLGYRPVDDDHRGRPSAFAEATADTPERWRSRPRGAAGVDAAATLGGEWIDVRGERFLVVDRKYSPGHRHGRVPVCDVLPPDDEPWPRLSVLAGATCRGRMLFVDLETTGLAGGAGSYAFLVGCAWFDGALFRTRQLFLSSFAAERALLEQVAAIAGTSGIVVTYNGKSFDLPLMETRFALHRMGTPFASMPHVDMVHPARRLWRADDPALRGGWGDEMSALNVEAGLQARGNGPAYGVDGGCRLTMLERTLCGHHRDGDVAGFEIPSRYFHYVRSGDARGLEAVMEHNRLDLLSLAFVTARASRLLEEGPCSTRVAREALGIGRLYERAGILDQARAAFQRAVELPGGDAPTRAEALRSWAVLARRERRYEEAAAAWRRLLDLRPCPAHFAREAAEALAVHHEHRLRDPLAARSLALQSMRLHQAASRRQALQHRLARLDRKIGGAASGQSIPLF